MKKNIIILTCILFLLLILKIFIFIYNYGLNMVKTNKRIEVKLNNCVDGDTVWLENDGKRKKYRLLGIDSPEIKNEYGEESSVYLCNILKKANKIEIEYDKVGKTVDNYNRELVWVFVDDELVQKKLLSVGLSKIKYIYATYEYLELLYDEENIAKNNKYGIWSKYKENTSNNYYTVTFNYTYKNKSINILKDTVLKDIKNPYKIGCRFIGWKNGNYLFDLSTKINKNYKLDATFDC